MSGVQFEQVAKRYPNGFEAVKALDLDVQDGELLVVVGPSGCGKSTTLRMLAGLESITDGHISIDGSVVNAVAARNRDIAMVFQSYALYPHLNVGGNLAYPLKLAGQTKAEIKERVAKVARQLRLEDLLDRKPRQLSGGQRQRVAMGRAMVREPRVFLMDEPLSNLDAKLRVSMRAEIAELQATLGTTMFYVTHDQIEAMTLGTRVAVMNDGVLQQCASPQELYAKPANTFVATFIGAPPMNLLRGQLSLEEGAVVVETGSASCTPSLRPGEAARFSGVTGSTALTLGLRPEDVRLVPGGDSGEGLPGRVRLVEVLGAEQIVHVELDGADWFVGDDDHGDSGAPRFLAKVTDRNLTISAGDTVAVVPDPARLELFDRDTNLALAI